MDRVRSRAGRLAGAWGAAVAVLVVLLVGAEAVPDDAVVDRLVDAIEAGDYGPELVPDGIGGFHDGFTECVALGQGLGAPPEPMGLVPRALWAPRIGACDEGADQVVALDAGDAVAAGPYHRYWNGYAVLVRPALVVGGLGLVRVLAGLVLAAGVVAAAVTVGRRLGWLSTVALFAPVAAASNLATTPAHGFTHAISMGVAGLGVAAVAVATDRPAWWAPAIAAAGGAVLFVYVDLLTTPAIPWALSVFVVGAIRVRAADRAPTLVARDMAAAAMAWPVAYAATWAARWVVAAAVHGREVFDTVAEISRFRLGGEFDGVQDTVGAAARANVRWWLDHASPSTVVLALALLGGAGALAVAVRRLGSGPAATRIALLAAPALLVPAWYELLSNHSQIHAFFTHRGVPVAVGIGLSACVLAATSPRPEPSGDVESHM